MTERILACPHTVRHPGAQPLMDGPLCPLCQDVVDVVGVDAIVQGGGTAETATGLLCSSCGWGFVFNPSAERRAVEVAR
jgi:hypothetical protein